MAAQSGLIRVSVVVPVYNTGEHIEQLIDSLAAQTLPAEQFEAIFVDDGSTDDTPARLDRLAEERHNVIVFHEPNSGWPGRPRNVGIDAARGDYVFFVDHDDWLGTEALERMTDFAYANSSDLVIGRYAGHRRGVAKSLFTKNRPNATLADTPLMDSLTPHKMFRKAFLTAHDLRFPEGRRRLEDHVFVTKAYFLAERMSVLSDYHCYFHVGREDEGNAGYQRIDPVGYYTNVREVVDLVLGFTEPGSVRDRYLRRTLRTELLGRLGGKKFLEQSRTYQQAVMEQARAVAVEKIPLSADAGLPPPQRVRAFLLREGRLADLNAHTEHDLAVTATGRLLDLEWDDGGRLTVEIEASLVNRSDGKPWRYERDGDALLISMPAAIRTTVPRETIDCTRLLASPKAEILLRRRADSEEWPVKTDSTFTLTEGGRYASVSFRASASVDLGTLGGGGPLTPGIWDVFARISQTGWSKEVRLGAQRAKDADAGRRPALLPGQIVAPYWTDNYGNLSLDVGAKGKRLVGEMTLGPDHVSAERDPHGHTVVGIRLPLFVCPGGEPTAKLRLTQEATERSIDEVAEVQRTHDGGLQLSAAMSRVPHGEWLVSYQLDIGGLAGPISTGALLTVSDHGRRVTVTTPDVRDSTRPSVAATVAYRLRGLVRPARPALGRLRRRIRHMRPSGR